METSLPFPNATFHQSFLDHEDCNSEHWDDTDKTTETVIFQIESMKLSSLVDMGNHLIPLFVYFLVLLRMQAFPVRFAYLSTS